jgi:HemY protein
MTRSLLFLLKLALVIGAAAWLADRPGRVAIEWQGYLLETSVGVLAVAVLILGSAAALLVWAWRGLRRAPSRLFASRRQRRRERGYRALTLGMVAVAAGDADEARRQAKRAAALLNEPPLTMLLAAQSAQLDGDEAAAEGYFKAMLERPETAFLGLRGLVMQARRQGDAAAALGFAERARELRPGTPWVLRELFELQTREGRWEAAENCLDAMASSRLLASRKVRRARGLIRLERSRAAEASGDQGRALELARDSLRMAPDLVAGAVQHARLMSATGRRNAAQKTLEAAWNLAPHPDISQAWKTLFAHLTPLERYRRMERLTRARRDHPVSRLDLAEAAIEAELWGEARFHLDTLTQADTPSAAACRLMASLAISERGDMEASKGWLERAATALPEPGWSCAACGAKDEQWNAVCKRCGGFDALLWQPPGSRPSAVLKPEAGDSFAGPGPGHPAAPPLAGPQAATLTG